jgi:hypothetical protein
VVPLPFSPRCSPTTSISGWRWAYWLNILLLGVGLVCLISTQASVIARAAVQLYHIVSLRLPRMTSKRPNG